MSEYCLDWQHPLVFWQGEKGICGTCGLEVRR